MANKIYNIGGEQQTNLLSNDNLVVYSDVSMKSQFNSKGTTYELVNKPDENDYLAGILFEDYIALSDTISSVSNVLTEIEEINSNENDISSFGLNLLTDKDYYNQLQRYVDNCNLPKYMVARNVNVRAVQNSLNNIFSWIPGERILNPEFGNTLYKLLYSGITTYNSEQIIAEIQRCVSEYEPRVSIQQIVNISDTDDTENNTIKLEIIYTIPSLNSQQYSYMYTYEKHST